MYVLSNKFTNTNPPVIVTLLHCATEITVEFIYICYSRRVTIKTKSTIFKIYQIFKYPICKANFYKC